MSIRLRCLLALQLLLTAVCTAAEPPIIVLGRVEQTSRVPDPKNSAYADCLMAVKVTVTHAKGAIPGRIIANCWAFKNRVLSPGAALTAGSLVSLEAVPWERCQGREKTLQLVDDILDVDTEVYWVPVITAITAEQRDQLAREVPAAAKPAGQ